MKVKVISSNDEAWIKENLPVAQRGTGGSVDSAESLKSTPRVSPLPPGQPPGQPLHLVHHHAPPPSHASSITMSRTTPRPGLTHPLSSIHLTPHPSPCPLCPHPPPHLVHHHVPRLHHHAVLLACKHTREVSRWGINRLSAASISLVQRASHSLRKHLTRAASISPVQRASLSHRQLIRPHPCNLASHAPTLTHSTNSHLSGP